MWGLEEGWKQTDETDIIQGYFARKLRIPNNSWEEIVEGVMCCVWL
jgi:hypothetical protein